VQRVIRVGVVAWAGAALLSLLAAGSSAQPEPRRFDLRFPHRPDELLVGLTKAPRNAEKAEALEQRRQQLYEDLGIRVLSFMPRIRVALLQIRPPGGDDALTEVAARLAEHPDLFEYVEPNPLAFPEQTIDPQFAAQWSLTRIQAPQAWNITTGDSSVVVGVIDSGMASDLDLDPQRWVNPCDPVADGLDGSCGPAGKVDDVHGWSFVGSGSANIDDQFDHGTQVAGVIGAVHQNGRCIKGVAAKVSLMTLKFSGANGMGDAGRAADALEYAVDASAHLVNASWSTDWNQSLQTALVDAGAHGILVVAAAGRGELKPADLDYNASYPCSFGLPNVLCVAATTDDVPDALEAGSSWGKNTVHLGAPGEDIYSVARFGVCNAGSGTSMAVPHVVGVAALVRAKCQGATVDEVRSRLLNGDPVAALGSITSSGTRLNARRALEGPCTPRVVRWLGRGAAWVARPFRFKRSPPAPPTLLE
jgi:subtilisin family serine protease